MKTLLKIYSDDLAASKNVPESSSFWLKIISHLFRDLLPSLLIIAIVGGLSLQLIELIDQHRPNRPIVMVTEK